MLKRYAYRKWSFAAAAMALFTGMVLPLACYSQSKPAASVKESDVLPYLEQVIAWRHLIIDSEQSVDGAREMLQKENLRQNSKLIVQKSFAFARAQADILESSAGPAAASDSKESDSRRGRILKAAADADKHAADLQKQLAQKDLAADEREKLAGRLKLAHAQQELLRSMIVIFSTEGDHAGTLTEQINAIYRSAQNGIQDQPIASAKEDAAGKAVAPKEKEASQDNAGMLNLSTALFTLSRKKDAIDKLIEHTRSLTAANRALIDSTRASLRAALADGDAWGTVKAGGTAKADDKDTENEQSLDDLLLHYKQLGAAIIPLGEISVLLENARQNLEEWDRLVATNWNSLFHQLILRLVILAISVCVPLLVAGVVRRAIDRYVTDPKRRRQLRIVRRILLGAVLTFVILANFLTEFGSLATFAGFITAGLAVALQTVLISLVAHFLYFGRYGIRAGDRVTISDVTGEVLQVGMMRLYLRQLKESENGTWSRTDKVVAYPNSILFQPTAFYKHINDNA